MAALFDLRESETILKEISGDYWEGGLFLTQRTGKYAFTSQRILFKGGFCTVLDLPYAEIESASLCNVGPMIRFMPTGILVTMKDGKKHRLSILKRKELLTLIESKL